MKLLTSHCAFALPYCHYNLYRHSFVLLCILMKHINCLCCCFACYTLLFIFHVFPIFFLVMLYYSYTQTFSLILLYCWYSYYCVSFCALLDGV